MSGNQGSKSGQGNNQSGGATPPAAAASGTSDLNIPTFAPAASAAGPVLQDGEDANALAAATPGGPALPPASVQDPVIFGANAAQMNTSDVLKLMDNRDAKRVPPVSIRQREEQEDQSGVTTVELPGLNQNIDKMRRPDQMIEPVADLLRWSDKAAQLEFLNEPVCVVIPESYDPNDPEKYIVLWVNGRSCVIPRGKETWIRRYYLAKLLRTRPERVETRIDRSDMDNPRNLLDKRQALKWPVQLVRDDNPKGRAWAKQILAQPQ
jgi:hypothetical protein